MTAGAPAAPAPPDGTPKRRRPAPLQAEDGGLFLWLAVAEPALQRWLGPTAAGASPLSFDAGEPGARAAALFSAGAALGAAVCLLTRPRGERVRSAADALQGLDGFARFPLLVLVAVMVDNALAAFGVRTGEGLVFGVIIALGAPLAFYPRLPALPVWLRRLLMMPTLLLGATAFGDLAREWLGDGELLRSLPAREDPLFGYAVLVITLVLAGTLASYVLLVVAPRKVAGAGGGVLWWALRFAVFLAGVTLNLGLLY